MSKGVKGGFTTSIGGLYNINTIFGDEKKEEYQVEYSVLLNNKYSKTKPYDIKENG